MMQDRARYLRKNRTDAENRIWYYLRNRRLGGYKFVREHVIGNYIADFVCREKKLIIEVDGGQHMTAAAYDQQRTENLEAIGYQVVRVWNNEVYENIYSVMENILHLLENLPPDKKPSSPTLLPLKGEGSRFVV
jgi:very-short-patch-repair endonuclease